VRVFCCCWDSGLPVVGGGPEEFVGLLDEGGWLEDLRREPRKFRLLKCDDMNPREEERKSRKGEEEGGGEEEED
jgi:hypothetical protein